MESWKQYRTFCMQELLAKYKSITCKCRSAIYSHHIDVENKVGLIYFDNINKFYRYANLNLLIKVRFDHLNLMTG